MANTWLQKEQQRKITYNMGGNETEIDFVLIKITEVFKQRQNNTPGIATLADGKRHRPKELDYRRTNNSYKKGLQVGKKTISKISRV